MHIFIHSYRIDIIGNHSLTWCNAAVQFLCYYGAQLIGVCHGTEFWSSSVVWQQTLSYSNHVCPQKMYRQDFI